MKKRNKKPNECHECLRGHELIAEYMGGEADTEPTRELLLHAQTCTNCATLLRSLKPLVLFCLGESNGELPGERKVLFSAIRRELPEPDPRCHECTEVHGLIAECVSGEPNDGFPRKLLRHLLSCPDCHWLLPTLIRLVHDRTVVSSIDMPVSVRLELRATILRVIHPD
jgi:hypothetical protein